MGWCDAHTGGEEGGQGPQPQRVGLMGVRDRRIDAYITKSAAFAQPILAPNARRRKSWLPPPEACPPAEPRRTYQL